MTAGGPPDEVAGPETPETNTAEVCVPLAAVSVNEDDNQQTAPSEGDSISVTLEGKVTRVEGDMVYFQPTTANGEPVPEKAEAEPTLENEGASLKAMSQEGGY